MKILVLGSGGREQALIHTFHRQGHIPYSYSKKTPDFKEIVTLVKALKIDLTVVGPEVYLEKGIQDLFSSLGLPLFGPSKSAARLETSKAFAKEFMIEFQIPTARVTDLQDGVVVKADGLAGGKGVICCKTKSQAERAIEEIKIYGENYVIEELLEGPEISLQVIVNGERSFPLLAAQDHKRLYDNNQGPNTGGMGAYAPLPFLTPELEKEIDEKIVQKTLRGLQKRKIHYQGVLYFGLMLTKDGPKVLEYNCRFGDPEAECILPLLETDLAELMMGNAKPTWKPKASCTVVLATKGYPQTPITVREIGKLPKEEDLFVFQGGTTGRVLSFTALANDLDGAIEKVYRAIDSFHPPWAHYRRDIGKTEYLPTTA